VGRDQYRARAGELNRIGRGGGSFRLAYDAASSRRRGQFSAGPDTATPCGGLG
jgi:hypothetical protein